MKDTYGGGPKENDAKPVRPAATVLLLRDGKEGLEVFMVVRHHEIDSFSGALVFPGGKVDREDSHLRPHCRGAEDIDDTDLVFRVAAIREAFEECGVLLAYGEDGRMIDAARVAELEAKYREAVRKNEAKFADMCEAENLALAVDALVHYAHWITPPVAPKLFDTHFYLAEAPADHLALHDGQESTDSVWIHPLAAIEAGNRGERTIVFPTRMNLSKLGNSASVAEALAAAAADQVITVQPKVTLLEGGGRTLRIPAEAGYPGVLFKVADEGAVVEKVE